MILNCSFIVYNITLICLILIFTDSLLYAIPQRIPKTQTTLLKATTKIASQRWFLPSYQGWILVTTIVSGFCILYGRVLHKWLISFIYNIKNHPFRNIHKGSFDTHSFSNKFNFTYSNNIVRIPQNFLFSLKSLLRQFNLSFSWFLLSV